MTTSLEWLTAILVFVTAIYVWVTHGIMKANQKMVAAVKEQLEASLRPYVTVGVVLKDAPMFDLRVANDGKTPAINLRLSISRAFFMYGDKDEKEKNLAELNAFKKVIPTFTPGAELIFPLATSMVIFGNNADPNVTPPRFSVTARYRYAGRSEPVEEMTEVDLTTYFRTAPAPSELRRIRELFQKFLESRGVPIP